MEVKSISVYIYIYREGNGRAVIGGISILEVVDKSKSISIYIYREGNGRAVIGGISIL